MQYIFHFVFRLRICPYLGMVLDFLFLVKTTKIVITNVRKHCLNACRSFHVCIIGLVLTLNYKFHVALLQWQCLMCQDVLQDTCVLYVKAKCAKHWKFLLYFQMEFNFKRFHFQIKSCTQPNGNSNLNI